jgi:3-hydroxymyristoyl/3-hydroxydecanoyl-(acyl carrier protein) dehydratase
MKAVPFIAGWQAGPVVAGAFEARLVLDDENLFAGHYPGAPIFPGTSLIEALFQAANAALGGEARLAEIVACRFHSPLFPGDDLRARFTLKQAGAGGTLVEATASGRAKAADISMLLAPSGGELGAVASAWDQAGRGARSLDASFIQRVLPHRPPALLIDSALVFDLPGGAPALLARKAVTTGEPCYPGTLIIESFCQACGLLRASSESASEPRDESKLPVVAKLAGLRFFGEAVPGDLLEHQVQLVVRTGDGAVFSGQTVVAGRVVLQVARVIAATTSLSLLRARPVVDPKGRGASG